MRMFRAADQFVRLKIDETLKRQEKAIIAAWERSGYIFTGYDKDGGDPIFCKEGRPTFEEWCAEQTAGALRS